MEQARKQGRNSNLELFRIIAMLLIISSHYISGSGVEAKIMELEFSKNIIYLFFLGAWVQMGINSFVLITGYFMCKKEATVKKFFKLVAEVLFYKIIIYVIMLCVGYESFTPERLLRTISPITDVNTGFVSAFLFFYLFIPYLNILIKGLNKKKHFLLVFLSLFLYTLWDYVPYFKVNLNYVTWFIVLYFVASFIRLYPLKYKYYNRATFWGTMSFMSVCLSYISIYFCMSTEFPYRFVNGANAILALSTAICLFMFFKNLHIKQSKIINLMGASTFGVLLIHANSDAMRKWLWVDTLQNVEHIYDPHLLLRAFSAIITIFIVCVLIDQFRIRCIERPFLNSKLYNRTAEYIQELLK